MTSHHYAIINVDDFGLHPAVNRAVDQLYKSGNISSTSLLANGDFLIDALSLNSSVSIGAHLNILRGCPISPSHHIPSLIGTNGQFFGRYNQLLARYYLGRIDVNHVEIEWRAQIETLLSHGVKIAHIDSEKHIHCWPKLFQVADRLAKDYQIPRLRRTWEPPIQFFPLKNQLRAQLLNFWNRSNSDAKTSTARMTWGVFDQSQRLNAANLHRFLNNHRPSPLEIICHPGLPHDLDPDLSHTYGRMNVRKQWSVEFNTLHSGSIVQALLENGYKVIPS